jgi:prepilin-type processing-associated H-X9-DG protein
VKSPLGATRSRRNALYWDGSPPDGHEVTMPTIDCVTLEPDVTGGT